MLYIGGPAIGIAVEIKDRPFNTARHLIFRRAECGDVICGDIWGYSTPTSLQVFAIEYLNGRL
jgi:hypothetical protein